MKAEFKPRINLHDRTPLQDVIPLATPFILFIDPASACNFSCSFCPTGHAGLIKDTGRFQGVMKLDVYKKLIDDLHAFDQPLKVLRLYKDGEPFLNKKLAAMIRYAKDSGRVRYIDTTTNASLLTPQRMGEVLEAGLDKINISVDGMSNAQYREFTGFDFDFDAFVANVRWLYANKGACEVVIKVPGELLQPGQREQFLQTFGDHCDRIFIENFAPCWPDFDVEAHTGFKISEGIYQQPLQATETCPYIFYAMSVNADGQVSACFLDWGRKLLIGDARHESLLDIWRGDAMNALRLQHLQGQRRCNAVCGSCGQLSHCLPDDIDAYREQLLARFKQQVHVPAGTKVPGSTRHRVVPLVPA